MATTMTQRLQKTIDKVKIELDSTKTAMIASISNDKCFASGFMQTARELTVLQTLYNNLYNDYCDEDGQAGDNIEVADIQNNVEERKDNLSENVSLKMRTLHKDNDELYADRLYVNMMEDFLKTENRYS